MTNRLDQIADLTGDQLAADPRIGMRKIVFEFLLQQEYFGAAAMMVAEFITTIQRIEAAENSGHLPVPSVKTAAILWRNEIKGFKHWFSATDDMTIARMIQELSDKGLPQFVAELAIELQVDHHPESQVQDE